MVSALAIPLLRETYAPVIRLRRAAKNGDLERFAATHPHLVQANDANKILVLYENLTRPVTLLFRSFICFALSLYMALSVVILSHPIRVMLTNGNYYLQYVWHFLSHVHNLCL